MWAFLIGGFLMRLTIGLILTCAWRLGAVTCQNSQKGVGKDRLHKQLKSSFWGKNNLREFFQGQNLLVNLPTGSSSNRCRCTAAYSDSSCVKTNLEIMIFKAKKNLKTNSYSGRHFGETKKLRLPPVTRRSRVRIPLKLWFFFSGFFFPIA